MVRRKQRDGFDGVPEAMQRFEPGEWSGGAVGYADWVEAHHGYWQGKTFPGGLIDHLAVLRAAREVAGPDVVADASQVRLRRAVDGQQ
jgi:hypothetical protein